MKQLPLKYKRETIIPNDIIKGDKKSDEKYTLITGEIVYIEYLSGFNNKEGEFNEILEMKCQETFGLSFSRVRSIWISRLGKVSDIWHCVKLVKEDEKRTTIPRKQKQTRR